MAEALSQSQIDALLSSMANGGFEEEKKETTPEKKYRKYDFYSPKKFTKDKLKILSNIYENYARLLNARINGLLRMNSQVEVVNVEEQRYYEFSIERKRYVDISRRPFTKRSRGDRRNTNRCIYKCRGYALND